jgi:mono/diheme cytochrome c family protein
MTRLESRLFCVIVFSFGIGLAMQIDLSVAQSQEQGKKRFLVPPPAAPSPTDNPTTQEKIALGKQLFFDPRLSGDNSKSCASCHMPEKAFTDEDDSQATGGICASPRCAHRRLPASRATGRAPPALGRVSGRQQIADFIERKADLLRLLDEAQPIDRFRRVEPKPAPATFCARQQPPPFVVADRIDTDAGACGQLSYAKLPRTHTHFYITHIDFYSVFVPGEVYLCSRFLISSNASATLARLRSFNSG